MTLAKETHKQNITSRFRDKTAPGSISKTDVALTCEEACDMMAMEQIDVFLIAGQSNARGMSGASGAANSPNPTPGTVYQYGNGNFLEVTDEVGDANTGSFWPSFAITWVQMTGRKICFVPRARNSTGLTAAANTGDGYWGIGGTLYPDSLVNVDGALAKLTELGYEPIFRGVLWSQGENDAIAINNSVITRTDYSNALVALMDGYRSKYGVNMPFYIFKTGKRVGQSDVGYAQIRIADEEVAILAPHKNKIVWREAYDLVASGEMADVVHYAQSAYNRGGRTAAENILSGRKDVVQSVVLNGTGDLAARSTFNTVLAIVKGVGIYSVLVTSDPPDNINTFASSEAGYLWQKIL